ncbi:MAG: hypothetical protein ABL917_02995 [Parcubacteria group bacterium]
MYTKENFIKSLENEVRIIKHLGSKVTPSMLDYRPTPAQRNTLELMQYISGVGSGIMKAIQTGDPKSWMEYDEFRKSVTLENFGEKMDAELSDMKETFANFTDADFSKEVDFYGAALVAEHMINILRNFSAYRMQLFLYIKSCGGEINTFNLWGGMDAPKKD